MRYCEARAVSIALFIARTTLSRLAVGFRLASLTRARRIVTMDLAVRDAWRPFLRNFSLIRGQTTFHSLFFTQLPMSCSPS